jgi:(R,R)-butanediol dehydrogenase / meso-butanediol dehydrogenase / diacetyl reductase
MKAAFYEGHETIRIGECAPVAPPAGAVRIRVSHCGICGTDLHIFHGRMDARVRMPQVLGHEMSGVIESAGEGVTGFAAGDRVTVRPLDPCGQCPACRAGHSHICQKLKFIGIDTPGAFQGLWTVPAHALHRLPASLSFELGALIEPLAVACHDVRLAAVQPGEYVVVQGGGPIGLLVALVARQAGARVLISEINAFRIQLASELGFAAVNPIETDVAARVMADTGDAGADVVFEVTAAQAGAEMMTKLPRTRGRIVVVGIFGEPAKVDLFRFFWRELKLIGARVYEAQDFDRSIELADSGVLPLGRLISKVLPIEELEAGFRLLERGGDVMKVVVKCGEGEL